MRPLSATLAALLLAVSPLAAQTAPAPPPPKNDKVPLPDPELTDLLKAWERKMTSVERLAVKCSRTEVDGLRGKEQVFSGGAWFLKPNMAMLDLTKVTDPKDDRDKPKDRELYISNGNHLYEFQWKNKLVRIHELPKDGGISDDTFLAFLFGMKAEQARQRYTLRAEVKPNANDYIYLNVLPKTPGDKQEFSEAQLVFYAPKIGTLNPKWADWALLPARLWFKNPNGNQVIWTFSEANLSPRLEKSNFVPPSLKELPKDWRIEKADAAAAADEKRPQSNYTVPNPDVPPSKVRQ
jgi:TIGR03009 family protein